MHITLSATGIDIVRVTALRIPAVSGRGGGVAGIVVSPREHQLELDRHRVIDEHGVVGHGEVNGGRTSECTALLLIVRISE